jgi:methylglutamate dehydrogenase subunit B
MKIPCSHCGLRGHEEFSYFGDAAARRPAWISDGDPHAREATPSPAWHDYVHLRDNPAGPQRELWQHVGGCRAWLVVTRDTRSHAILGVEPARAVAANVGSAP